MQNVTNEINKMKRQSLLSLLPVVAGVCAEDGR